MWGYDETVAVVLDTTRTVLKLLEEYPDFLFSQSQASVYRILEEYAPSLFEQVKKAVRQGRWEVTASTWVEADKNMTSLESMARQMLYTKRYFRNAFGLDSAQLQFDFEPDTFGHCRELPEILTKGGTRYYYHYRGFDRENVFRWQAQSGAEVLVYSDPSSYGCRIQPELIEAVPEFCQKNGVDAMLRVYGVSDHGGGPTRRDLDRILDMRTWPIAPEIRFSTYADFFSHLEKVRDALPVIRGELNPIFTGCYSSQSRIKRANRKAENALYVSEVVDALAVGGARSASYGASYEKAWQRVLFNQFHDILPGSGVRETREYALAQFQEAMGYAYAGQSQGLQALTAAIDTSGYEDCGQSEKDEVGEDGGGVGFRGCGTLTSSYVGEARLFSPERGRGPVRVLHLFNPTAYDRDDVSELCVWDFPDGADRLEVTDSAGQAVEWQIEDSGSYWSHHYDKLLVRVRVPAFGYRTLIVCRRKDVPYSVALTQEPRVERYAPNILENEYLRAEFAPDMTLISLIDKATGREQIGPGGAGLRLGYYNDRAGTIMHGNAWVEGEPLTEKSLHKSERVYILERKQGGALRQSIRFQLVFGKSQINGRVTLDKGAPVLKLQLECHWKELFEDTTGIPALSWQASIGYETAPAWYKTAFGFLEREENPHDWPALGCVCVPAADGGAGLTLLSDATYAFRGGKEGLRATLLRSTQFPDGTPEAGTSYFTLGLGCCTPEEAALWRADRLFNVENLYVSNTPHTGVLPPDGEFIQAEGPVSVEALKNAEDGDGMIIRLLGLAGAAKETTLRFVYPVERAELTDVLENPLKPLEIRQNSVSLLVAAGEMVTVRVNRAFGKEDELCLQEGCVLE